MTRVIEPILERNDNFNSTLTRFGQLFQPINNGHDAAVYLTAPLLDSFIFESAFALDASIHLLNAIASFVKSAYMWSMLDESDAEGAGDEFNEGCEHLTSFLSAVVAQTFNTILSTLALLTRPVATVVNGCHSEEYGCKITYM